MIRCVVRYLHVDVDSKLIVHAVNETTKISEYLLVSWEAIPLNFVEEIISICIYIFVII